MRVCAIKILPASAPLWVIAVVLFASVGCFSARANKSTGGPGGSGGDARDGKIAAASAKDTAAALVEDDGVGVDDEVEDEAEEDDDQFDIVADSSPTEKKAGRKRDAKSKAKRRRKRGRRRSPSSPPPPPARVAVAEAERVAAVERSEGQRRALVARRVKVATRKLKDGALEQAIVAARGALAIQSDDVAALAVLAEAYYRKAWYAKAQRVLGLALQSRVGKKSPQLWMLRGLVLEGIQLAARRSHGASAVHTSPFGRGASTNSNTKSGTNNISEVRAAYETATRLKPNYAKAWNNLGVVYLGLQRYPKAIAAFETAVSIDKDSVAALTNLGTAYRRHAANPRKVMARSQELLTKAEHTYRTVIALDEEYGPAYLDLGLLYLDTPTFPGLTKELRLKRALQYLREFKLRGFKLPARSSISVDAYLEAAQLQLKSIERKKRPRRRRR